MNQRFIRAAPGGAAILTGLLSAISASAAPLSVAGIWTLLVDQEYVTLELAQGAGAGSGGCAAISGKIDIVPVFGFYCPSSGRVYFHHQNLATLVTVRTFDGSVSDATASAPAQMAGKYTVVNTVFQPFGDYPFSGTK